MKFKEDGGPSLDFNDPMDRWIGRNLADTVLRQASVDDEDLVLKVEFADELKKRCQPRVS